MKERITALYERLSRDDDQQGESNSIINQKKFLEDYAKSKGFTNLKHFTDDGYSGTNFNRPGFTALLEEIKAGNVAVLCIKDMSRLGRNYLQVGFYTEMLFPEKGVRFIAVNNNIDSDNPTTDNEFTPFLNIMNEWYAKDTSKKIRAVFKNRMENGLRCSGSEPYGYFRKPGDKQTFYVDEEAATVIRRIFNMAAEGISPAQIAETLTKEEVFSPAAHQAMKVGTTCRTPNLQNPFLWHTGTVRSILQKREYLGHTVLGKTECTNFKSKKRKYLPPEDWLIFPNTHEPIIDQETWNLANKMVKRKPKRVASGTYTSRLSGLVFCADCGSRLSFSAPSYSKLSSGTDTDSDYHFQCSQYRGQGHNCTSHYIKQSDLEAILLKAVQAVSDHVLTDEDGFINDLMDQWLQQRNQTAAEETKELASIKKRLLELDQLIQGLYESKITGSMPGRQIERLINQYDAEQLRLESRATEIQKKVEADVPQKAAANRFVVLVKKYQHISELNDRMLYELIDKVVVHAPIGSSRKYRFQKVDVYFSFIGKYTPAGPDISEEERIAQTDALYEEKKEMQQKRANERVKENRAKLKELSTSDPVSAAKYQAILQRERKANRKYYANQRAKLNEDPSYQVQQAERKELAILRRLPIKESSTLAESNPKAAEVLNAKRERNAQRNRDYAERRKAK